LGGYSVTNAFPDVGRSLVVLHVDDDPMNLRVVDEILSAFGHTSVRAGSGAEALSLLAGQAFDVVLMDIHMPQMTGIEAVAQLRQETHGNAAVPVIALTADVVSRRPEEYRALGFNDFVSKPILVSGLMEALKRAASPAPTAANDLRRTA
jgi:CheY-like chemotaxis protein